MIVLLVLLLAAPCFPADLFRDDFSRFPAGWLSYPVGQLNGAIQEYHYLSHRGIPLGPWENAISHLDAWVAGEEDGISFLEQHLDSSARQFTSPMFLTGDPEWSDYAVQVKVRPLSTSGYAGIVFRYKTNRHYYVFSLAGGNRARLAVRLPIEEHLRVPAWRELAEKEFVYDTRRYYELKVENEGPRMRAFVDGRLLLAVSDSELLKGKIALTAAVPARFGDVRVTVADAIQKQIADRIHRRNDELGRLRAANPKPKLWKKFDTPRFGAGRNARFGDLNGDGITDMLIAQNIPRVTGDAFDQISCLTAIDLDGNILWQTGRPDPRNGLLTNDSPFQIHDVNGDGRNEVVMVKDFKIQILDGRTGKLKNSAWMPPAPKDNPERPYDLEIGDSIAFINFSGNKDRREILIKDRYRNFWIFNNKLELLWKGQGQTGHYPYPYDIDGDGKDKLLIGYSLWDHTGTLLWSRDSEIKDHADGAAMGNFSGDPKGDVRIYASGSDEGFMMFDRNGGWLKHVRIGHAQSPCIGKFREDIPGLQYFTVNFWRNPGIVTLFDFQGNLLEQEEPIHSGSVMLPVNWRGDGQEFVLLSSNSKEGGMIDGHIRRVVMFPDDGHPDLTAAVLNLTGDPRNEIVLWDQERVWIYTQDRPFTGKRIYAPVRNPDYNDSNYRLTVSLPAWKEWP